MVPLRLIISSYDAPQLDLYLQSSNHGYDSDTAIVTLSDGDGDDDDLDLALFIY